MLPITKDLKEQVAGALLTSKGAWAGLLNGNAYPPGFEARFQRAWRISQLGGGLPRSCPALREALLARPAASLAVSVATRAL
eukprot:3180395-Alexandrium_andersonii.AAC.1